MSIAIDFAHAIGDRVRVLALDLPGMVSGQMADECGLSYRVVWWSDGDRKSCWLAAWEIAAWAGA